MSHFFQILFLVWLNVAIFNAAAAGISILCLKEGKTIPIHIISIMVFWLFVVASTVEIIYLG